MTTEALPDLDLDLDLEEIMEPGVWAVWLGFPLPDPPRFPECPRTGWLHEGRRPFRVFVSRDPFRLPFGRKVRPYTGSEPTLDWDAWLAGR